MKMFSDVFPDVIKQSLSNDLLKKDSNEGSRTATIMSQEENFSSIIQMGKLIMVMVYILLCYQGK